MAQQIQCPNCGQAYELSDEQVPQYAGQTITCTKCQKQFTVPREIAGAAGAPPPPPPMTAPAPAPAAPYMQPPVGYGGYAPPPPTSGLAIAALVLGVIGLIVPGLGVIGIVLGIIALVRMADGRATGKGLAIGGIAVGVVSLMWAGCIMSILLPSLNRARETANRVKCASNMRQIGQAILLYSNENNGAYPDKIEKLLVTQDITSEVFNCPSSNDTPAPGPAGQPQASALNSGGHNSYVYVGAGLTNQAGANVVVLYEPMSNHDNDGTNILWADGHVSWEQKKVASKIIDQVKAGQNPPKLGP